MVLYFNRFRDLCLTIKGNEAYNNLRMDNIFHRGNRLKVRRKSTVETSLIPVVPVFLLYERNRFLLSDLKLQTPAAGAQVKMKIRTSLQQHENDKQTSPRS